MEFRSRLGFQAFGLGVPNTLRLKPLGTLGCPKPRSLVLGLRVKDWGWIHGPWTLGMSVEKLGCKVQSSQCLGFIRVQVQWDWDGRRLVRGRARERARERERAGSYA